MDGDQFGFRFHKTLQIGSVNSAYMNDKLTVPRFRQFGVLPNQFTTSSGLLTSELRSVEAKRIRGDIRSYSKDYAYLCSHIDNMVTCLFKNKTSSIGGISNPQIYLDQLFSFFDKYSLDDLILEPRDGLRYYAHIEEIAFSNAIAYELTEEEVYSLRVDIPNHVINKCVCIFNQNAFD